MLLFISNSIFTFVFFVEEWSMYRILLVDDETDVRESIARMIDWDTQGFSLCGCAAGSLEALEMADELLPDVVMTDICMPYIDGLELIRRLRKVHPAMQFVIVSGYDDFSYAQQAVQLHVMDYLLKPLSRSGVEAVLQRVRARLDAETLRRRDVEELRACAKRDQLQLQRMALIESITDDSPNLPADGPGSLAEFLPGRLGVVELLSGQEQEAALAKDFGGNPGLMEFSVRQIAQELTETGDIPGLCAPHRKRLVLLLPLDADSAVSACERLMDTVRMYLHLPMRAAVSAPVNEISQLSLLYQRTLLLTGSAAPFASGSVFLMEEHPSGSSAGPSAPLDEVFGQISALVRSGDAEKTRRYFSDLGAALAAHENYPSIAQALRSMVETAVLTTGMRTGLPINRLLSIFSEHPLPTNAPLSSLLPVLLSATLEASRAIAAYRDEANLAFAQQLWDYIAAHFSDPQLSISVLCDVFHISQTQLSLVFRRDLGTTFLQYVLDMRIDRARQLLLHSDKKVYEIALETGFEDPGYFSYCFRQRCGLTPKNFRQEAKSHE